MSDKGYRPWRSEPQGPSGMLEEQVALSWRKLVEESRRSITELTSLRSEIEQRMQSGAKLVEYLRTQSPAADADSAHAAVAALEKRLGTLEKRLEEIESALLLVIDDQQIHPAQPTRDAADEFAARPYRAKAA